MNNLIIILLYPMAQFKGAYSFALFIFSLTVLVNSCQVHSGEEKIRQLSSLAATDTIPGDWEMEYWSEKGYYSFSPSDRSEYMALVIDADSMTFHRWQNALSLKPYSRYRVSGWIKTENVIPVRVNGGAGFRIVGKDVSDDPVFSGDTPWTYVEMEFDTDGDDSAMLECVLGKGARARGRVYFDEIVLELIHSEHLEPEVLINTEVTFEPMNEYIYGQFIEHMGRCIYGGIWAEMLFDRKFNFSPGHDYSIWEISGESDAIKMVSDNPYAGEHDVVVENVTSSGNGILQGKLGLLENMGYEGRIILTAGTGALPINVDLIWGDGPEDFDRVIIEEASADEYITVPLEFFAEKTTSEGVFRIEPQGSGPVRIGVASLMPSNNIEGFRADVLELMKKLDSPVYLWPGGNFVSGYFWKDGVGERDKRPPRYEEVWEGWAQHFPIEPNDVGIDEFMRLCELLETEANIAVNTGLGTPREAAEQVKYVNGSSDTEMGAWRAENGRTEPYGVKLWAVGNEMFGDWQLGVMPIEKYVEKHNETSRLMWEVDSGISLIAVGYPGRWNDMMYTHSAEYMTYISEHFYRQDWHAGGLMTHVKQMPDAIRGIADEHRRARREIPGVAEQNIMIAMDEWNYWYRPHVYGLLGTRYFLQDALGIAAGLNELLRQSDIFVMANYAQTVNVIGAIKATITDAFMAATGEVLQLYRREFGYIPVESTGNPAPLDVAASLTTDGKYLTESIVNATEETQEITFGFEQANIPREGELYYITGSDRYVYNEPGKPEVREYHSKFRLSRNNSVEVPAMSACIYKFELK